VITNRPRIDADMILRFQAAIRDLLDRDDAVATINDTSATIYLNGPDEARYLTSALQAVANVARSQRPGATIDLREQRQNP
jgi:hypothetical protein